MSAPVPRPPEHVRCRNFGCNKYFDPARVEETTCVHHKKPPVFHETAKYWACCQNSKAYDWDEFMKIPGCQRGHCSAEEPAKKHMGGTDLRAESAPKRLDEDVPVDPRKKLDKLREGLSSVGVDPGVFDRSWGKMAAKHGDLALVVHRMNQLFTEALVAMDSTDEVELPD
mmetsp:Transcript_70502/g.181685  ORF Transcript_70502/g.181685 Transcript_70502/m.181685 type:complete len:170 (+) Transcript_70502:120-629(+)